MRPQRPSPRPSPRTSPRHTPDDERDERSDRPAPGDRAAATEPPRDGAWDVPGALEGKPLDGVVRALAAVSWADARKLIETGKVFVAGAAATSPRRRVLRGERLEVRLRAPRPETARRQKLESDLLVYLDASVVVVNKPAGVSTVPFGDEDPAEQGGTLDALVREVLARRDRIRGRAPLGVVHRLDKATSGLLVFARTFAAKKHLGQQLRFHTMHRRYLAIAHGVVPAGTYRSYLVEDRGDGLRGSLPEGKRGAGGPARSAERGAARPEGQLAVTHVQPVETLSGGGGRGQGGRPELPAATLISCRLETGRTHQIRIHLAEAGHPLVGEAVYVRDYGGPRIAAPRLMLHAAELGFRHPADDREMRFQIPPPADFERVLSRLRGER